MDVLHHGGHAATASQLLERLQETHSVHKTTVYRNLAALEEAGLVRRLPSGGRSFIYELSCPHRLPVHPHFTCRSCGEVVCLDPVDLSSAWETAAHGHEITVEEVQLTLSGLCADCRPADDAT
jgi:Fe2+ or Zn2+ uptake regulation protein